MSLEVYKASAGAGKTYTITETFLQLVLSHKEKYKHILAVTFTNLATLEMKERFLQELFSLAIPERQSHSPYCKDLCRKLHKTPEELANLAGEVLKEILFNFSQLRVKTIDSFFQEVIRNFALELAILSYLRIELSQERVIATAIDRLFATPSKEVEEHLLNFIEKQQADSTSSKANSGEGKTLQKIRSALETLSKELYKEVVRKAVIDGSFPTPQQLQAFTSHAESHFLELKETYSKLRALIIDPHTQKHLIPKDQVAPLLKGKSRSPILRIYQTEEELTWNSQWFTTNNRETFKAFLQKGHNVRELPEEWQQPKEWPKASVEQQKQACVVFEVFIGMLRIEHQLFSWRTAIDMLPELHLLIALSEEVKKIKEEEQVTFIDDAKELVQRLIGTDHTPFIYERIGGWLQHYMIDEFQDTSPFQYHNFLPLLKESASQQKASMIVGDVKQSIYLFRNSDASLLQHQLQQDFPDELNAHTLEYNWRSAPAIVAFNNYLFSILPILVDKLYAPSGQEIATQVYKQHIQRVPSKNLTKPGGVFLHHYCTYKDSQNSSAESVNKVSYENAVPRITTDSSFDDVLDHLPSVLLDLLDRGYSPNDIAILARRNTELEQVATKIIEFQTTSEDPQVQRLQVVSDALLSLSESLLFRTCVTILKTISWGSMNPKNKEQQYYLSVAMELYEVVTQETKEESHAGQSPLPPEQFAEKIASLAHGVAQMSLYDVAQDITKLLFPYACSGEETYLLAFLDLVNDFDKEYRADPALFLDWIENHPEKLRLAGGNKEAVRLLTIHKAKGLGFPVVLLVSSAIDLLTNRDIIWAPLPQELQSGTTPNELPTMLPIKAKEEVKETLFEEAYNTQLVHVIPDKLNTFYVACTRAKEELHIWIPDKLRGRQKMVIPYALDIALNQLLSDTEHLHSIEQHTGHWAFSDHIETPIALHDEAQMNGNIAFSFWDKGVICSTNQGKGAVSTHLLTFSQLPIGHSSPPEHAPQPKQNHTYTSTLESLLPSEHASHLAVTLKPTYSYRDRKEIVQGEAIHQTLQRMLWQDDLTQAIHRQIQDGVLSKEDAPRIETQLRTMLASKLAQRFFSPNEGWEILNERTLLHRSLRYRPDRIQINPHTHEVVVIDYKTGVPRSAYRKQVASYCQILQRSGYNQVQGYLLYIRAQEESFWEQVCSL